MPPLPMSAQVALHPPGGTWNGDIYNLEELCADQCARSHILSCCHTLFLTGDLTQLLSHSYQTFLHRCPGNCRMGIKIAWRLHCCFSACAVLLSSHQTVCQSIVCFAQVTWHPPGGTWDGVTYTRCTSCLEVMYWERPSEISRTVLCCCHFFTPSLLHR